MAQADRQPAPKLVYLEVVTTALRRLGLSEESIRRGIFRGCVDGSLRYDHTGEAPPPDFWRNGANVRLNASDISNVVVFPAGAGDVDMCTLTLSDVMLAWEDVIVKYPALRDTEPPDLGTSRVEVSFTAPLMRQFEALVRWLRALWRRPVSPAGPEASATGSGSAQSAETAPASASAQSSPERSKKLTRENVDDWLKERYQKHPIPWRGRKKTAWFKDAHDQMKLDFEPVPFGEADSLRRYFDKNRKIFESGQ